MRGVRPKQRLRFVTALVALPLFVGGINYCLINELAGLPPCGVGTQGQECPEHSHSAAPSHHHGGVPAAPASPQPSGATHPCCTSLVGVVVPKLMGPAAAQPATVAAVLVQATAPLPQATSWYGRRHGVPTEHVLPSLHRSPSAPRAPPLS